MPRLPFVRDLVRSGLRRVLGPPGFDPASAPGDPGLFGPGSASWRVIGDQAAIIGGIRALVVQLLHPLAVAGVADHSRFRDDPLGRLHRTSAYVTTTAFGSTAEALRIAAAVRRAHRRVTGTAPDGRRYRADDPHLLGWVSLTLTDGFLAADRAYARRPVDAATADAFVAEQSRAAALLDPRVDLEALAADPAALPALRAGGLELSLLADGVLPVTVAGLRERLDVYRGELALTAAGRYTFAFLRWPPVALPLRAVYLPLLAGALATLEPPERTLLALPPLGPPVQASTRALLGGLRLASGGSPAAQAAAARAAL